MTDPIATGARNAAQHLAPHHGTGLTTAVERALHNQQTPDTYLDPTALGSLIPPRSGIVALGSGGRWVGEGELA